MNTVDAILGGHIALIVNTPYGVGPRLDGYEIRTAAVVRGVPCITTVQGLGAAVQGIEALISGDIGVRSLQEHAAELAELRVLHAGRAGEPPPPRGRDVGPGHRRGRQPAPRRRLPPPHPARPGHPGGDAPRALRGPGGRWRGLGDAAATGVLDPSGHPRGASGGTVEVVFATHGKGTRWLADRRRGDKLDVIGPLGQPFTLPKSRSPACWWPAATGRHRCSCSPSSCAPAAAGWTWCSGRPPRTGSSGSLRPSGRSASVTVTTDDGSSGIRGRVTDPLGEIIRAAGADVVYACGPMAMLAAVAAVAAEMAPTASAPSRSRWPAGSASA